MLKGNKYAELCLLKSKQSKMKVNKKLMGKGKYIMAQKMRPEVGIGEIEKWRAGCEVVWRLTQVHV